LAADDRPQSSFLVVKNAVDAVFGTTGGSGIDGSSSRQSETFELPRSYVVLDYTRSALILLAMTTFIRGGIRR